MRWDFEDDATPVPGGQVVGYLRFFATDSGCRVEVHQAAQDAQQGRFLTAAWSMVLGRFKQYANMDRRAKGPRPRRPKHHNRRCHSFVVAWPNRQEHVCSSW